MYDTQYEPAIGSTHPRLTQRTVKTGNIDLPTMTDASFLRWSSSCILWLNRSHHPAMIIQQHSTTHPTSASSYDQPAAFYDSSDLSFQLRSSSCILRLIWPQLPATIIQLHSTTQPNSASSYDQPAAFYDSTDLSFQLRSTSCILRLIRPPLPAMILQLLQRLDQPTPTTRN